ncbi:hypothetical protein AB0F68_22465 [Micromonospora sp. NPDC023966]|uniref:pentapeptide repeat-containing protein n=1 Tax=Micromonospora sp. NPDC023966 TaxID=3154699 RepID=UPI0033FE6B6F
MSDRHISRPARDLGSPGGPEAGGGGATAGDVPDLRLAGLAVAAWLAALAGLHTTVAASATLAAVAAGLALLTGLHLCGLLGRPAAPVRRYGWIAVAVLLGVVFPQDSTLVEELEVRRAAQDLLNRHFWYYSTIAENVFLNDVYWGAMDLNLRGATLVEFDLGGCRIGTLNLSGAILVGESDFQSCHVTASFNAPRATFDGNAEFSRFKADLFANFRQAHFVKLSDFTQAEFRGLGYFMAATFSDGADFTDVLPIKLILTDAVAVERPATKAFKWPDGYEVLPTDQEGWDILKRDRSVPPAKAETEPDETEPDADTDPDEDD